MTLHAATLAIIAVNVAAWLTPGPNMLAVIGASLAHGRRHGLATGAGLAAAAMLWALAAVLGVGLVFALVPALYLSLKLAGAAYLCWLGLRALGAAVAGVPTPGRAAAPPASLTGAFRTGFLVSITNPKAALFFGSVLTSFVPLAAPGWYLGVVVVLCGGLAVALHTITATVFSTAPAIRAFTRFRRGVNIGFGLTFLALGLGVARSALTRS